MLGTQTDIVQFTVSASCDRQCRAIDTHTGQTVCISIDPEIILDSHCLGNCTLLNFSLNQFKNNLYKNGCFLLRFQILHTLKIFNLIFRISTMLVSRNLMQPSTCDVAMGEARLCKIPSSNKTKSL